MSKKAITTAIIDHIGIRIPVFVDKVFFSFNLYKKNLMIKYLKLMKEIRTKWFRLSFW